MAESNQFDWVEELDRQGKAILASRDPVMSQITIIPEVAAKIRDLVKNYHQMMALLQPAYAELDPVTFLPKVGT